MIKYTLAFVAALILSFALYQPSSADNQGLYVVTTTAQISDIVKNVTQGSPIRIEHLMGTGVDPHLYRPTRSDVVRLKKADIVFYNGLHLEGQMIELFEKLKKEKPVISLAESLPEDFLITSEQNKYDPHIWMNVKAWINSVETVKNALTQYNPPSAALYSKRAQVYSKKLTLLDTHIKTVIKTIPQNARTLITAHDAFGYFGKAYDINVIGIQGLSTENETGLKRMEELGDLLTAQKIPSIFSETSVNNRNIKALIQGAKSKGHKVKLGGALYSDAMGKEGTYEGTYIGMMEHNVRTLTKALGGTPDPFVYENAFAAATPTP